MPDLLGFALAQQAVINEHAGELVTDGLVHEGRGDGGIDAAGQTADHLGVADLVANLLHLVFDDAGGIPVVRQAGALVQEGFDELLSHRGVLDFRMPLHAVQLAGFVLHGCDGGAFGVCQHFEAFRSGLDGHSVAHPCVLLGRGAFEQAFSLIDGGLGLAILAQSRLVDIRSQRIGHGLEAVADAQHGDASLEQLLVHARGAGFEH